MNNFEHIACVNGDGNITINKYRSTKTGLTIAIARVDGPIVNGYFCIATEAHDNDGLPHTLEHLIFLGSDDYPYKGVLDLLANRCLASGTNAWTDTDHTCYTLSTAGSDGFLKLLPIYLDHVLFPTLTDSGFITEVHHINGDGENAGVVYCEMMARENSGDERCNFEMLQEMYPGICGYKSNTGGLMKNLRESTTNEKIIKYHHDFYRSENLCVIIAGEIEPQQVFKSIAGIEEKILSKRVKVKVEPFSRPWQTPVPPLSNSVEKVIQYPCDDDNNGIVMIAWRGPSAVNEYDALITLSLLTDYLNDNAVSPLQHEFVECDDPYCSCVDFNICENSVSYVSLSFESVDKEKLNSVKDKLFDVLNKIVTREVPFDMNRMTNILHRKKMHILNTLENSAHNSIASSVIGDFLYGNTEEDLRKRILQIPTIEELSKKNDEFWINMIKSYFLNDAKYVHVICEPSPVKMEQMADDEKKRIEKQRKDIGKNGLKNKAIELEKAKENNEIAPPIEMLRSIAVPSVESINYHKIKRWNNHSPNYVCGDIQGLVSLKNMPFRFQIDNIKTNFITIRVFLNTSQCLSKRQRLYLPLWGELISESPILRNGVLIPYEDIVNELSGDTVSHDISIGMGSGNFSCGQFSQIVTLMVKVEVEKYLKGINWVSELLYSTQFTTERIKVIATRMINDIAQIKRKGNDVSSAVMKALCFNDNSNHWAIGFLRQQKFLSSILKMIETNPQELIDDLNGIRTLMTSLDNITVHLTVNFDSLSKESIISERLWIDNFLPQHLKTNYSPIIGPSSITSSFETLYDENYSKTKSLPFGAITGVGSVESNFMLQCVGSINKFTHDDLPSLLVLMQYLTQLEGPMWRQIRGMGLSYHYNLSLQIEEGLIYLILYKATHLVAAYREALNIVKKHIEGDEEFSETLLESSRSSLIFEIIELEKSVANVSHESMVSYFKNVDISYNKGLINKVAAITVEDLKRVGTKYLSQLFDSKKSKCSICCHPSKVKEMITAFKEFGRDLSVINLDEENFVSVIA